MDPEHTPIKNPDSHHNFLCPDDATVIPTSPEGLHNSGASSSSKQTAASRVPSLFWPIKKSMGRSVKETQISLCGLRNRLGQEDHARDCQELGELTRICCEEINWSSKTSQNWRIVYATTEESYDCESDDGSNSGFTEQSKFLVRCERILTIRNHGAALEWWTFPVKLLRFWVPGLCHASILDCRERHRIMRVLLETFLNDYLSTIFHNSKNLASSSQDLRPAISETARREREMKRESLFTPTQSPHFRSGSGMLNHAGGTHSHGGMMDYPRILFMECNLGIFLNSMEFQSWKINFRTEVCLRTADPQVTMLWIKEVEIAKSIDELVTSRSITGQPNFPDFDMVDAMIASALKKLLNTQSNLPEESKCRRAASSEFRPILTRKTNCVHDLRVFPFRCKMVSCTGNSKRNAFRRDPGSIIQVKITDFSTSDCDGPVWSRRCTKQWNTELSTVQNCSETSSCSDDGKSKLQSPKRCCGTRISYQESRRKQSQRWDESGSVFLWKAHGQVFQRRLM